MTREDLLPPRTALPTPPPLPHGPRRPAVLFTLIVVFPLAFSLNAAYQRRPPPRPSGLSAMAPVDNAPLAVIGVWA